MRHFAFVFVGWIAGCASGPSSGAAGDAALPGSDAEGAEVSFLLPADDAAPTDCRVALRDGSVCACRELGQRPPTLYLLLDRSGSMGDHPAGSTRSKWSLVRRALVDPERGVLRQLGSRIAFALSWFPSPSFEDACRPGRQVIGPTPGSPEAYDTLASRLTSVTPAGATPTAASLRALVEVIAKLPPPVHVLLATDGAPSCGSVPCSADACTYNLEGRSIGMLTCDASTNCCDPATTSIGLGVRACVDGDATAAAAAELARAGVKVFVLGVPGTVPAYRRTLENIARAGGGDRYFEAAEAFELEGALTALAAEAINSCTVGLEAPIDDPGLTNVLLDGSPLANDEVDGWSWSSPSSIELKGKACARVHAGLVTRIQIAVGCRTIR